VNNYPNQSQSTNIQNHSHSITPINTHTNNQISHTNNTTSPFQAPNIAPINPSYGFNATPNSNNNNFNPTFTFDNNNNQQNQDKFLAQFNSGVQNRSFDHGDKGLSVVVPDVPKNDIVYPGLESVQKHSSTNNTFVFDNMEIPAHNPQTSVFDNQPKTQDVKNDFDFGFPDVKIDPFSQNKQQDDIFKTTNKFEKDPDWDF
jgi:hypothetical protein